MRERKNNAAVASERIRELRAELARRIAFYIGSAEKRITDVPGLLLCQADRPNGSLVRDLRAESSRGRAGAQTSQILARPLSFFDASRFLLTSLDLPVVSQVIEASEKVPCPALSLKLEMSVVRELLSREEVQVPEAPSDQSRHGHRRNHAWSFSARAAALWTCWITHRIFPFSSSLIQREIIYRILRGSGERAFVRSPHWEIKVTARRKRSRGSARTMRNRYVWKISQKWRAWACRRCTIISGRSPP